MVESHELVNMYTPRQRKPKDNIFYMCTLSIQIILHADRVKNPNPRLQALRERTS